MAYNNDDLKGKFIDINDASEIKYWCDLLGCERDALINTVFKVGSSARKVDDFLFLNRMKKTKMTNKNLFREPFSTKIINQVWEKAQVVPGHDPRVLRKDSCGAMIRRNSFGENSSELSMGWEIDHIKPISKGGTDDLVNLQALQWKNNRHKGDSYPSWDCFVY
ncbi:MAG TPA: DUF3606 domain-containing protein, partial [Bacteroidia bacterium]|nr:DUF3606 domain-containing protein [Bacteroidia bacterium]